MGEQDQMCETNMNNSIITFDNFTILKEFSNIANLVRNEDFLEIAPKLKGVKWVQMFNCLKQEILSEMVQEMNSMWEFENMPNKLMILDNQKKKFTEMNPKKTVWRPQHNDVKRQLRAFEVANLRAEKALLEPLAIENESKANRLKKIVAAKRAYLKALQMDIQNYQKKNEQIISKIHEKLNKGKLSRYIVPEKIDVNDILESQNLEVDY